jgi:autotransporter translocation and assembly factor TamB
MSGLRHIFKGIFKKAARQILFQLLKYCIWITLCIVLLISTSLGSRLLIYLFGHSFLGISLHWVLQTPIQGTLLTGVILNNVKLGSKHLHIQANLDAQAIKINVDWKHSFQKKSAILHIQSDHINIAIPVMGKAHTINIQSANTVFLLDLQSNTQSIKTHALQHPNRWSIDLTRRADSPWTLNHLHIQQQNGYFRVSETVNHCLTLHANHFNPEYFISQLYGHLNTEAILCYPDQKNNTPAGFNLKIDDLSGFLKKKPFALTGTWDFKAQQDQTLHIKKWIWGNNTFSFLINPQEAAWKIKAKDVSLFSPDLHGSIDTQGKYKNKILETEFLSQNLTLDPNLMGQPIKTKTIHLKIKSDLSTQIQNKSLIEAKISALESPWGFLKSLHIQSIGNIQSPTLYLELHNDNKQALKVVFEAAINKKRDALDATLTQIHLTEHNKTVFDAFKKTGLSTIHLEKKSFNIDFSIPLSLKINSENYLSGKGSFLFSNHTLSSSLDIHIPHLEDIFLNNKIMGAVDGHFDLWGPIQDLNLSGALHGYQEHLWVPLLERTFQEIELHLEAKNKKILWNGRALAGKGQLSLKGVTALNSTLSSEFEINGTQATLIDNEDLKLIASPHLIFKYTQDQADIQGTFKIDQAQLHPQKTKQTIKTSEDVIIIQKKMGPDPTFQNKISLIPQQIRGQVEMQLGEHFLYQDEDLKTRLSGTLLLHYEDERLPKASGNIMFSEGRYQIYGHTVPIETGLLIYNQSPLDNPELNIQAAREVQITTQNTSLMQLSEQDAFPAETESKTGTVGIHVQGTLKQPILRLYSSPLLEEADQFSYLLFGIPSYKTNAAQGQMMLQTLQQAFHGDLPFYNKIKTQLSASFSVDEMSFQNRLSHSQDNENQLTLLIGKYFGKNLLVRYGISLVNPVSLIETHYKLSEHWKLEAHYDPENNSGGDLIYSRESEHLFE